MDGWTDRHMTSAYTHTSQHRVGKNTSKIDITLSSLVLYGC